jgi:lipoate-protein ligase A
LSTLASSSIYDVPSWSAQLSQAGMSDTEAAKVGTWMDNVLGVEFTKPTQ